VIDIGGWENDGLSANTYFFNTDNEVWMKGPQLKHERFLHSCQRIRKDSQSQEFSIIVVGGNSYRNPFVEPVEVLDPDLNEWRRGPDLPHVLDSSQLVEDQKGGDILMGGNSVSPNDHLDSLFQLVHAGKEAKLSRMEQKLKVGRKNHVAFLVPDSIVECS
jgi:hypothetical protein